MIRRCALSCSLLLASTAVCAAANYEVMVSADLATLTVEAQFPAPAPQALEAQDGSARKYLGHVRINGRTVGSPVQLDGSIALPRGGESSLVNYTVDLRAIARARRFPELGAAGEHAVLTAPDAWLWLPPVGDRQPITLRFQLPEGMSVSAPWPQRLDSEDAAIFAIGTTPRDWPALVAIGRFEMEAVEVSGAKLRLAVLEGRPAPDQAAIRKWIGEGAAAVAGAYGLFPLDAPQVLVVPLGRGVEPVPWGQVLRGGGAAAQLFIDQTRPAEEFRADWVLVHELSHMLHPNLHEDGEWLAEGLATYYQNVLRARSGVLAAPQAWQKLHDGFQRGMGETEAGVTLNEATHDMLKRRLFMRVYWSGAAMALIADLQLRRNGQSLDRVLSRFHDCCLAEPRMWLAAEFLETLDGLAGMPVFMPLYRRFVDSDQFPDLALPYAELGLEVRGRRVVPGGNVDAAALRRAIMGRATQ
ncbi:MAG: hypothetical protein HYY48_00835 [Gammaproteobacteria bacterium]|nr:hypothetical protein [Gammaproteobacteria bacterium]